MQFLYLVFSYCMLNALSCNVATEYPPLSSPKITKWFSGTSTIIDKMEPETVNAIYKSLDDGQTWVDISEGLPENIQVEDFFMGESEAYLRLKEGMYRYTTKNKTQVWESNKVIDKQNMSLLFTPSKVIAFNYQGEIFQKANKTGIWLPIFPNLKTHMIRTIYEGPHGTLLVGCDNGLLKSIDNGQNWKQVTQEGWVMKIIESEGVLVATCQNGIMLSKDNGDSWESVIKEGGVGIDVERIEGGFAAITYNTESKTRRVRISLDYGKTWNAIDAGLKPSDAISSIRQCGKHLVCGHPDGIFRSSDMGKTWKMVQPGVHNKVFNLYTSGNILFAVTRNFGC